MRNLIRNLLSSILVFITATTFAQFTLSGEIRPRTEYLHGFGTLPETDQDAAFWTEQRSRIKLDYVSEKYRTAMVLQDIRTWGSVSQLNKSDGFSSVHEAWVEVLFNQNLSLKVGRQEVSYDDQRIFGNVGWAQQARSHDLGIFRYKDSTVTLDVGLAFNQNSTMRSTTIFTVANNYKTFQYLWLHKQISKPISASILLLNNGLQSSNTDTSGAVEYNTRYSQTIGAYLTYKKNKFKLNVSFYNQIGKDVSNTDLEAYNLRGEIAYQPIKKITLATGYELISGTSQIDVDNNTNNSFTPLYGTNHKFNGFMDYFFVGNHFNTVGVQDAFFKLKYKQKKLTTGVDVHLFSAAADILDIQNLINTGESKAMNSFLGTELDFTFKYQYTKEIAFQAGYSQLFATISMEAIKSGDRGEISNWAYFMITVKPVFFKQKLDVNKKQNFELIKIWELGE